MPSSLTQPSQEMRAQDLCQGASPATEEEAGDLARRLDAGSCEQWAELARPSAGVQPWPAGGSLGGHAKVRAS